MHVLLLIAWIFTTDLHEISALDIRSCDTALGMESGTIPDSAVTASSSYVPNVGPKNGRLRLERAGGAWCPKPQVESGVREYLQVDLRTVHVITGVQTQGRYDHGRGQEYAEEYTLEYWRPGLDQWRQYSRWDGKQILSGNSDTATVVSHRLMPPVFASQIRVLPYSVHRRTVCLRIELLGCISSDGVVSYSVPKDESWEPGQDLSDVSYDGQLVGSTLVNGLGRLVDGTYGGDNFKMDVGLGKGNGWIGWKNESFPKKFIELTFEFDTVRNFSLVNIFTNNCFTKQVQVFSKARIWFSIGGSVFSGRSVSYSYMPDKVLENARNVTIHLRNHLAKYVKLQLYFASKWIMISEVTFESEPIDANLTEEVDATLAEEEIIIRSGGVHDSMWDSYETIAAPTEENGYVEVVIGVLTAVMLLLLGVFVIILVLSRRQKLQGSPTTILRNPFGVTINMKDLLLNLTPLNTGIVHVSAQPTPASQDPPSDHSSMCFEQTQHYHTPLVNPYYTSTTYASVRTESPIRRESVHSDDAAHKDAVLDDLSDNSSMTGSLSGGVVAGRQGQSYSTLQFRSLQNTPIANGSAGGFYVANGSAVNLGSVTPYAVTGPDSPIRKRYHTAPREKHRLAPPAVAWNIAPSMGQSYKCREGELIPIPRYCLRVVQKIGSCHVGEAIMCEMEGEEVGKGKVVVKTMRGDCIREMKLLSSLNDQNVVRTIGVCTAEQPPWAILEYPADLGNLEQLLTTNETLKCGCLMFMTLQIASGMKYLESKNLVHKDLAARNCLVGRGYTIKIADIAICNPMYENHYSAIGGRPPAPIRWQPWESILLDRHTCASSVWSFAVTVWEIFSRCNEIPFSNFTNDEVVQNAEQMYYGGELQTLLPKPSICMSDVYEVMTRCWKRDQNLRPTFRELYLFLKRKHMGETTLGSTQKKIDV
ncbi:discoidin domain-containing receptor 2-like isoform X2 [Rhodnius prolixus]|uniref:discoidin domain-containing receptor 2-like isoform X2 n=1 Tax=Rhodnius prolixus TaxID=13249 RepID=UPI003D189C6D